MRISRIALLLLIFLTQNRLLTTISLLLGGIAIYYTPIFYFAFGSGMHEMVICFNFLFNLSLYCCCLAFLKTKLYLLKAKKKGGACFWCCFCFFWWDCLFSLFWGKIAAANGGEKLCVFGLKTSIFSLSKSKRTIIGSAVATCFFIFALFNYCVISFHFQ